MSSGTDKLTDHLLDTPARLLAADRAAVRAHIAGMSAAPHVGREVFQQAEAIFGGEEVSRAEFASWLQFAAKVLGHDAYAEGLAAVEPGMPWRTVWAWWRPVGKYVAHPNLTYLETPKVQAHNGQELLRVKAAWEDTWLDLETGVQVPGPAEEATVPLSSQYATESAPSLEGYELSAPEAWEWAEPLGVEDGRMRYLLTDSPGIALLETDPAVLRDWPQGVLDPTSSEEGTPGQVPSYPAPTGPLTAERLDEAFAPVRMVRIPEQELLAVLEHPASRAHLRDLGLPSSWVCAWTTFEPYPAYKMTPPDDAELSRVTLPDGLVAGDLLTLGASQQGGGLCDLYLHRREGSVHIVGDGDLVGTPG